MSQVHNAWPSEGAPGAHCPPVVNRVHAMISAPVLTFDLENGEVAVMKNKETGPIRK